MNRSFEIFLLIGLGGVKFGMNPRQVREIMNEEEVYEDWMGGNLNDSILFQGIILSFNKCNAHGPLDDSELDTIRIYNRKNLILFGRLINDWSKDDLMNYSDAHKLIYSLNKNGSINYSNHNLEVYFNEAENSVWMEFFKANENAVNKFINKDKSILRIIRQFLKE